MKHIFFPALAFLLLIGSVHMNVFALPPSEYTTRDTKISQRARSERNRPLVSFVASALKKLRPSEAGSNNNVAVPAQNITKTTWQPLFDGKTLTGWTVPVYGGDGTVDVQEGNIVIGRGEMMTGIRYEKEFPKIDYEIQYEARRTEGYDFFAACTFPVQESFCTLINGGWGGGLTGLSSVDGYDASENSTSKHCDYIGETWYRFRIGVTAEKIQVWLTAQDKEGNWGKEESIIELEMEERGLSTRFEMDKYKPLGFCTWTTEGQLRNIEYRKLGK